MDFIHLHVHSHLSLLDSTIKILPMARRAAELGMTAVALTDHSNLFGAVQFAGACRKAGIKPIYGSEILVADPDQEDRNWHLVLLCRTTEGFANLRAIVSRSYLEGLRDGKATTTHANLAEHSAGLTALSGCMGGEIPQAILRSGGQAADDIAFRYQDIYGEGNFFLEMEGNDIVEQQTVNAALADLSKRTRIPLVATNNAHYMEPEDAVAQAVLLAIDLKRTLNEEQRKNLPLHSFHFATPEEMTQRFADTPEAIENTVKIAESVEPEVLKTSSTLHFPVFDTPEGKTTASFLRELSLEGLKTRMDKARSHGEKPVQEDYDARLEHELELIVRMGFDAYYLIVWDFIRWARDHDIPVGPGRGSGAGSLVAYAIGVTDIDPIRYGLLFERFLNPERVSPPDFDIDFCMDKRDQVIDYVGQKYGSEYVGQIITYSQLKARAAVRDVARVMGLSFSDGDKVAKLIPIHPKMTLDKALAQEPRLTELISGPNAEPGLADLWKIATKVEGLSRQPGKHAAGVVIADKPIAEYAPLFKTDDGVVVTQFNMKDLDAVGLIKFDFLGLTALTVIDNAVKWIRTRSDKDFRIEDIPLDDKKTFELLTIGATAGVFQLESRGITSMVRNVKPDCIDDIIAILALYRPGPLGGGMVDDFILCKHGEKEVDYPIPELKPILEETYGVILYQEQVMRIASRLAGFSLGRADLLRRAMGKKKAEELEAHREPFIEGATSRGADEKKARELFQKMEFFAEYGFNKSHSAAYAFVTYRTAFLKAHHPAEFLCAVLTAEKGDQDKLTLFIHEARDLGVDVLLPDVNRSESNFTVEDATGPVDGKVPAIRFGLSAVKGVGDKAVDVVLEARQEDPFEDFLDFLVRVDPRKVNRRVLEAFIRSGSLDCFGHTRRGLYEGMDRMMDYAQNRRAERDSGQMGLFDGDVSAGPAAGPVGPPDVPEWPMPEVLSMERAAIGYYVSGHPLDPYVDELNTRKVRPIGELADRWIGNTEIAVAGIVVRKTERVSKTGDRMAFLTLEDTSGQVECKVFPKAYPQWAEVADAEEPLLVRGNVVVEGDSDFEVAGIVVRSMERLEAARRSMADSVMARLELDGLHESVIDDLAKIVKQHPGRCPVVLVMRLKGVGEIHLKTGSTWAVEPSDEVLKAIESVLGTGTARLW